MKNKNNIAFSVILLVYNQASFVRRAIKSMMAQTYDNWELIIVNDGSTDRTAEFVASFIDGARVRYIYQVLKTRAWDVRLTAVLTLRQTITSHIFLPMISMMVPIWRRWRMHSGIMKTLLSCSVA